MRSTLIRQLARLTLRGVVAAACILCVCELPFLAAGNAAPAPTTVHKLRIASDAYHLSRKDPGWAKLLDHIDKEMKVQTECVPVSDPVQLLAMFKYRQIDFAYMSPLDYMRANKMVGAQAVAIQLNPDGKAGYYSIMVTKKSSGIKTLEQAKGKTLGFVQPDSVSGYKIPVYCIFKELGQPISVLFPKTVFTGHHVKVIEKLWWGEIDAGVTNSKDIYDSCSILGIDPKQFNIIWKSPFIPQTLFAAPKDLPPEIKKSFADALFSFRSNKKGLKELRCSGFAKPDKIDFSLIQELYEYLEKHKLVY